MKIKKKVLVRKKIFEYFNGNSVKINELTSEIGGVDTVNLSDNPMLLESLLEKGDLDCKTIKKEGLANETTKFNKYLGQYTVFNNLAAYVKQVKTADNVNYLIVYGLGEVQNGRNILYVSGIYEIEYN